MLHVDAVTVLPGFRLRLRFNDGVDGVADLTMELDGPMFAPLRDTEYFALAYVDAELRTVAWPNGADFAPEFLQALVLGTEYPTAR